MEQSGLSAREEDSECPMATHEMDEVAPSETGGYSDGCNIQ